MRADNQIGAAGAASLAPSLGRMTHLTLLDLSGTILCIGMSCAVSGCLRSPTLHRYCCGLHAEAVAHGAVVDDGVCEGAGRDASVLAVNEIQADGAGSLAPSLLWMTQLTSLDLGGALRASA